jgi:hypothetical protein
MHANSNVPHLTAASFVSFVHFLGSKLIVLVVPMHAIDAFKHLRESPCCFHAMIQVVSSCLVVDQRKIFRNKIDLTMNIHAMLRKIVYTVLVCENLLFLLFVVLEHIRSLLTSKRLTMLLIHKKIPCWWVVCTLLSNEWIKFGFRFRWRSKKGCHEVKESGKFSPEIHDPCEFLPWPI